MKNEKKKEKKEKKKEKEKEEKKEKKKFLVTMFCATAGNYSFTALTHF